ncbi:Bug family tripartite tricarboxylate transporter substrate binding protein [Paracandidimonas soli]|uniref:Bug family tripartite tricarboxylate transporter substrate binding protein n=1 Tax=Paracandidimonas soli TaxID=1917182 RepID=UPI00333E672B
MQEYLQAFVKGFCGLSISVLAVTNAYSQDYPSRPINMIAPFPAGSATDTVARLIGEKMAADLGQTIVVENIPGASGTIAAARAARAKPDGYTIMIHTTIALSAALYDNLSYDTATAFAPIGMVNTGPYVIATHRDYPAKDGKELLDNIRQKGSEVTISNAGVGTGSHLCAIMLSQAIGAEPTLVPYKSTNLALQDVMAGHVDMLCDQTTNAFPHMSAGKIKAYATTSPQRHANFPDLPTTSELGIPDVDMAVWHGLYAPKGTPAEIVDRLNAALQTALGDKQVQQRLDTMGTYLFPDDQRSPSAHAKHLAWELERFDKLVKEADLKLN